MVQHSSSRKQSGMGEGKQRQGICGSLRSNSATEPRGPPASERTAQGSSGWPSAVYLVVSGLWRCFWLEVLTCWGAAAARPGSPGCFYTCTDSPALLGLIYSLIKGSVLCAPPGRLPSRPARNARATAQPPLGLFRSPSRQACSPPNPQPRAFGDQRVGGTSRWLSGRTELPRVRGCPPWTSRARFRGPLRMQPGRHSHGSATPRFHCRPWLWAGGAGVTDRPARESRRPSLGSNLLLGGLFFLERINVKPAEIGSIEHLPNPALSSFHLSIHLSN